MKTKLLVTLLFAGVAGFLHAADDPFTAVRTALEQSQLAAAEAALEPLVSAAEPDARAWFYLSQVRARQQKTKEAIELAEKAVAADPNRAEFQSNLGMVLGQRAGEVNFLQQAMLAGRMLGAFKRSVELEPDHIPGLIGLVRYHTNAPSIAGGGREPAERYARELAQRNPQLGTIELARIAERFDDPVAAHALYTEAASVAPESAWIQEALGRVSEKLQRIDEARRHYENALALDPKRTGAKDALTRIAGAKS